MQTYLIALIAVAGTLMGAITGGILQYHQAGRQRLWQEADDRRRERLEWQRTLRADRIAAYPELFAALNRLYRSAFDYGAVAKEESSPERQRLLQELHESMDKTVSVKMRVELLASYGILQSVRNAHSSHLFLAYEARDGSINSAEVQAADKSLDQLAAATRAELDLGPIISVEPPTALGEDKQAPDDEPPV